MGGGVSTVKGEPSPSRDAQRRRRRVLFGSPDEQFFERVPPMQQFAELPDQDVVFERLGDGPANHFRLAAKQLMSPHDGLLGEDAIEVLGLGLGTGSLLSQRLFSVAQVQRDLKRPSLTCYELLALHSVLCKGHPDELLELLFCIFDADGDDLVSEEDFKAAVGAFVEVEQLFSLGHGASELDELAACGEHARQDAFAEVAEEVFRGSGTIQEPKPLLKSQVHKERRKRSRRRGFCSGKSPVGTDTENSDGGAAQKTRQTRGCLPCASQPRRGRTPVPFPQPSRAPLTFEQWSHWLESVELPSLELPGGMSTGQLALSAGPIQPSGGGWRPSGGEHPLGESSDSE